MDKCEVVLVYMKPGAFGELQKIRPPTASSSRVETTLPVVPPLVIPQNDEEATLQTPSTTDSTPPETQGCANSPDTATTTTAPLPKIDIFMTQHCSIPLIQCDFDSALKAVNSHNKEMHETTVNTVPDKKPPDEGQTDKSREVRTSSHPQTVINYKQFLEEYTDAPPTPPRKKCEVDLKRKPSKQRIAADKFRSKFTIEANTPTKTCKK